MKYVQPYGISDEDASYINGDPSQGRQGSIPPAAAFEHPMREIVNVITKNQLVPTASDLLQMVKANRSQRVNYAEDTGSTNTLTVAFDPPLQVYTVGLPLRVRVRVANTGACTIDAGAGRVNIRRPNGSSLVLGDLSAGGIAELVYDGTLFQMINYLGAGGGGGAGSPGAGSPGGDVINNYFNVNIPYTNDISPTPNLVTANFSPAITALTAGDPILVKIANNNNALSTITVNALPAKQIRHPDGSQLLPEDIIAGGIALMIYDGVNFVVLNPNPTVEGVYTVNVPSTQFNTPAVVFSQFDRKLVGPAGKITVVLAAGVYPSFKIYHSQLEKFVIKGTMIGPAPTLANFAMSGASAGARASDAAFNVNMLRARYGTEIRESTTAPAGTPAGIIIESGNPTIQDVLITGQYPPVGGAQQHVGVGSSDCTLMNVAVWGLWVGFGAYDNGLVTCWGCWASGCYYGYHAMHGGSIYFGYSPAQGFSQTAAVGCDQAGFIALARAYMLMNNTFARCNALYGVEAGDQSSIDAVAFDSLYNGSADIFLFAMSFMRVTASTGYVAGPTSPAVNSFGNNNSLLLVQ